MHVDGACLCGHITYTAEVDPNRAAVCHCSDCQANSGTAFGHVVHVVEGRFNLLTGTLKEYVKIADSGRTRILSFCPDCGTRIHARTEGDPSAFFGLRVGSVRQRADLPPRRQVWCRSAQPWVWNLGGIEKHETGGGPGGARK